MTAGSSEYFDSNPAEAGAGWATWLLNTGTSELKLSATYIEDELYSALSHIYGHPSNPKAVEFKQGADAILSLREDEIERPKPVANFNSASYAGDWIWKNASNSDENNNLLTKKKLEEVKKMLDDLEQTGGVVKWTV